MSVPATKACPPAPRRPTTRVSRITRERLAMRRRLPVHLPGHRVAGLGPVEGDRRDRAVAAQAHAARARALVRGLVGPLAHGPAFARCSPKAPASARAAQLCRFDAVLRQHLVDVLP